MVCFFKDKIFNLSLIDLILKFLLLFSSNLSHTTPVIVFEPKGTFT